MKRDYKVSYSVCFTSAYYLDYLDSNKKRTDSFRKKRDIKAITRFKKKNKKASKEDVDNMLKDRLTKHIENKEERFIVP